VDSDAALSRIRFIYSRCMQAHQTMKSINTRILTFGLTTTFAIVCRAMNVGFGLVVFFPIYALVILFHIVTLFIVVPEIDRIRDLNLRMTISQVFFISFLLFSMDAGDSTGGLTILVALDYFGMGVGLKSPTFFYGTSGLIIQLIQSVLFLTLDTMLLITLKRKVAQ